LTPEERLQLVSLELSAIERKKQIARMRLQGASYQEIGQLLGVSRQRVEQILRNGGGKVTKGNKKRSQIIALYLQGQSRHQIALKLKCSVNTVTAQLKKAGMEIRDGRKK